MNNSYLVGVRCTSGKLTGFKRDKGCKMKASLRLGPQHGSGFFLSRHFLTPITNGV